MAPGLWVKLRICNIHHHDHLFSLISYWYQNGCLFPDMATVFIAIDKADVENGCLKVV